MGLAAWVLVRRAEYAAARAARERRRRLERDLAGFVTAAEQRELLAVLARHPEGTTWELRAINDRLVAARARSQR